MQQHVQEGKRPLGAKAQGVFFSKIKKGLINQVLQELRIWGIEKGAL